VSQFFCGVFDTQQAAQVVADFYRGQTFDVTGPTQYDAGSVVFTLAGAHEPHGFGQSWLVVATSAGAAPKADGAKAAGGGEGGGKGKTQGSGKT
jgi:hypothetical protein